MGGRTRRVNNKRLEAVHAPTGGRVPPKAEPPAPFLNFAPLQNALTKLDESCKKYDNAMKDSGIANRLRSREVQQSLDNALRQVELAMITNAGLPRRPWYRHEIYAPGFYTGYGVK